MRTTDRRGVAPRHISGHVERGIGKENEGSKAAPANRKALRFPHQSPERGASLPLLHLANHLIDLLFRRERQCCSGKKRGLLQDVGLAECPTLDQRPREDRDAIERLLSRTLAKGKLGGFASVMCCPIVVRQFQIFFAGRALKIGRHGGGRAVTLADPAHEVRFGKLNHIDWRKLHLQLRRRLERVLGKHCVVVGMGEVEADYERKAWQPHYHLAIFDASRDGLELLRKRHYLSRQGEPRLMKNQPLQTPGWYAYIAKLTAFRKIVVSCSSGGTTVFRKRLKVVEEREYYKYLAVHRPTEFVFAMNCSIVRASRQRPA